MTKRHDLLAVGFEVCDGGKYIADWQSKIAHYKRALAAEAQLERVRAETWQPIETAPKGRSAVLLYESETEGLGPFIGYWSGVQWLPLTVSARWETRPTHWQPLPAPPEDSSTGKKMEAV